MYVSANHRYDETFTSMISATPDDYARWNYKGDISGSAALILIKMNTTVLQDCNARPGALSRTWCLHYPQCNSH